MCDSIKWRRFSQYGYIFHYIIPTKSKWFSQQKSCVEGKTTVILQISSMCMPWSCLKQTKYCVIMLKNWKQEHYRAVKAMNIKLYIYIYIYMIESKYILQSYSIMISKAAVGVLFMNVSLRTWYFRNDSSRVYWGQDWDMEGPVKWKYSNGFMSAKLSVGDNF